MQFTEIPLDERPIIIQLQMNDTFGVGRIGGRHRTTMERDEEGNIYAVWKFEDGRVARIMATLESVYQEPSEWSEEIARQLGVTSV